MTDIQKFLFENRDEKYRDFSRKLVPNIEGEKIIGVRAPALRDKAKRLAATVLGTDPYMKK